MSTRRRISHLKSLAKKYKETTKADEIFIPKETYNPILNTLNGFRNHITELNKRMDKLKKNMVNTSNNSK